MTLPELPRCICLPNDYEYDDGHRRNCPRHGDDRNDLWAKNHKPPNDNAKGKTK